MAGDLHRNVLRPKADALFDVLAAAPELSAFTLMGGTALALQIGHRLSLDFDFAVFGERLPTRDLDLLISRLKAEGHKAQLITSHEHQSQFRINNGESLLGYARDYVVNGVKVTFFVHGNTPQQQQAYIDAPKLLDPHRSFAIMGIDGLKIAKTLVLADRVRSRDLFDVDALLSRDDFSLDDFFGIVRSLSTVDDPEYYRRIMRGITPLDPNDEGLEPVEVDGGTAALYQRLTERLDRHEIEQATRFFADHQNIGLPPDP